MWSEFVVGVDEFWYYVWYDGVFIGEYFGDGGFGDVVW